jgi:DNA-binding MarR family transcriptional regulator
MQERVANLLAAYSQLVSDTVADRLARTLPHAGGAPAALITIGHESGLSIERLSRALRLTHSGTVRLVDRLESEGLVNREKRSERQVRLSLTRRGRTALQRIERARIAAVDELLSALTEEQQLQLDHLLAQLLGAHTHGEEDLRRTCRLCSFNACESDGCVCPVAEAVRAGRGTG